MITNITIENYKSILKVPLELSRVNVFIGENGAGKSNILEAIALVSAASANKLDNEFLASRGIRVTKSEFMRPAFFGLNHSDSIVIKVSDSRNESKEFILSNDNKPYSKWTSKINYDDTVRLNFNGFIETVEEFAKHSKKSGIKEEDAKETLTRFLEVFRIALDKELKDDSKKSKKSLKNFLSTTVEYEISESDKLSLDLVNRLRNKTALCKELENFIIYSPEHTALRTFQKEGQVEPLGINGEGLLKLISVIFENNDIACIDEIKTSLKLLGWFEDFKLTDETIQSVKSIEVKDYYIESEKQYFDQMSTNEGFLFLLFYFTAMTSNLTPNFFAIDNIDASLNPKLCEGLIKKLVTLAKSHDKQVVLTTHNPATLDGLNLDDDEQRLFVVSRGRSGETKVKRVKKPSIKEGDFPVRLSEMFIKGILGGIPKGF